MQARSICSDHQLKSSGGDFLAGLGIMCAKERTDHAHCPLHVISSIG
jgi:hypothetical protein